MIYVTRPLLPKLEDYVKQLEDIWQSQWLTNMGTKHNELEESLKLLLKARNLCLFNNGTIALMCAIKALDLPLGSEVITTPFTFAATPHSLVWNGLTPVFCDIRKEDMTIDPDCIEKLITDRTSAILGVHVYGFPCDVERIGEIARKHHLKVIYDAAHAFTTEINGKGICEYGDITMYSFHATKLFNTIEGGAVAFSDDNLLQKVKDLRNFGIRNEEEVESIGLNGKMNEFQAAMGLLNLRILDEEKRKKEEIKKIYQSAISKIAGISIPVLKRNVTDSYQYFPLIIEDDYPLSRDELYDYFKAHGVHARKYFYPACSDYSCYRDNKLVKIPLDLKIANDIKNRVICLPYYGALSLTEIEKIIDLLKSAS